jgi:predicted lipoprotein with Yx(FWY)xxD motif
MKKVLVLGALAALALVATACGGSSGGAAPGSAVSGTTAMVSVKQVDGMGKVLVDSKGMALYSPEQESGSKVLCTGSCTSIWVPLTLSGSGKPTGTSDVQAKLGTVDRPDGATQVTGNGFHDRFGGQQFTWEVASVGAVSSTSTSTGRGY